MSALERWLRGVEANVARRKAPAVLAARLAHAYGVTLPKPLARLLETIERARVESLDPEPNWMLFEPRDFVVPDGERPFASAVKRFRTFTGGFGFLQLAMPMVPIVKMERADSLFVVLGGNYPIVMLPQDSLFDICESELFFAGRSLDTLAKQLEAGELKLRYEWDDPIQDRHLAALPFGYLLTRTSVDRDDDDGLDLDIVAALCERGEHRAIGKPPSHAPENAGEAFYELSRAYFFETEELCAQLAAKCARSAIPIVADMGRAYAELSSRASKAKEKKLAGVPMAALREALRDADLPLG